MKLKALAPMQTHEELESPPETVLKDLQEQSHKLQPLEKSSPEDPLHPNSDPRAQEALRRLEDFIKKEAKTPHSLSLPQKTKKNWVSQKYTLLDTFELNQQCKGTKLKRAG